MDPNLVKHKNLSTVTHSLEKKINMQKKSFLSGKSCSMDCKRMSSRATIQWEEGTKQREEKTLEEKIQAHKRSKVHALGLLVSRGAKWSYIQDIISLLKSEEGSVTFSKLSGDDDHDAGFEAVCYGMVKKRQEKCVDLSLDQQEKLELLKHKTKMENDEYLKQHPELNILLSKVYRELFFKRPEDPKLFVANYVHYLNTHREDLYLDEVNVPFDQPPKSEMEQESVVDERKINEQSVKEIVEECFDVACKGEAFFNVTTVIDSLLREVSPSDTLLEDNKTCPEEIVLEILKSALTEAVIAGTRSAELICEQVMELVLENICPSLDSRSNEYEEVRQSVEYFIQRLLRKVQARAMREVKLRDGLLQFDQDNRPEVTNENMYDGSRLEVLPKPILKKELTLPSRDMSDHSLLQATESGSSLLDKAISKVKFFTSDD